MKKIVDLEKLKEICDKIIMAGIIYDNDKRAALNYVNDWLESQPDAEEEKRGKWIRLSDEDYKCSNCNEILTTGDGCHPIDDCGFYYCPTCGAKMDLGEEE
jgi:hypothetical protein